MDWEQGEGNNCLIVVAGLVKPWKRRKEGLRDERRREGWNLMHGNWNGILEWETVKFGLCWGGRLKWRWGEGEGWVGLLIDCS